MTSEDLKSRPTLRNTEDIDESPVLAEKQVLHRILQDGSKQDYFVYRPGNLESDAPLFVAVHDISRNAREQATAFSSICETNGAILVAPHFAANRYPDYQRLGQSRQERDRGRWADEALALILDDVTRLTGASAERIYLFGFGAGGRFALRYAMAHPGRVSGVVVASADAFTFPDVEKRFPRGIAPRSKRPDLTFEPGQFLRVPMTVLEGTPDARGGSSHQAVQDVQASGATARDKARSWVSAMKAKADACHLDSLVSYREIDEPLDSFEAFLKPGSLPERVFETLHGPLPGLPAVFTAAGSLQRTSVKDAWFTYRDAEEGEFTTTEKLGGRLRRKAPSILLVGALLAFLVPVIIWTHYRSTHVLSRDAVVRSHIADVGARLDGVIKSVEVDAGDRVKAGQVVARLENSPYVAKVSQARSQLEKSHRELEVERLAIENERQRLRGSLREVSAGLSAARAGVLASESRAEEAQRQLELQKSLASQGLVPAERVRTSETELRTAMALAAESRAHVAAAGAGEDLARVASSGLSVREKRVAVLESDITAFEAELALAAANLDATIIRAPDAGAVVRRIVQPGGSISVGQPVISLWVGEELWVEAWLDEDDLTDVAVGSPATVTFKSHPNREYAGVVEALGVSTDMELPDSLVPQRRQDRMRNAPVISVRIRLSDPGVDLFPGLSAVVGISKKAQ